MHPDQRGHHRRGLHRFHRHSKRLVKKQSFKSWKPLTPLVIQAFQVIRSRFTAVPSLAGFRRAIRTLLLSRCRFNRRWLVCIYPSQQSDLWRVHESGGNITFSRRFLLLSTFFPGLVGRGGQLLYLRMHKRLTNLAFKLLNTGIISHPFSLHLAHFLWLSNRAIMCPQVPLFCPGEDIMMIELVEVSK